MSSRCTGSRDPAFSRRRAAWGGLWTGRAPSPSRFRSSRSSAIELAEAERITLSEVEFSQYVLDEWGWREDFLSTNAAYSRRAADLWDREGRA
jgi:hypothetical protein